MRLSKLEKPSDWWIWIDDIRIFAEIRSVWIYVDPDGITPEPERPVLDPSLLELNNEDTVIIRDGRELELWTVCLEFQKNLQQYENCHSALLELRTAIRESVPKRYYPRPRPGLSVREMIQLLRASIRPSRWQHLTDLSQTLERLSSPKRGTNVESWLREWRDFVTECECCPEYSGSKSYDLLCFYKGANFLMPRFTEVHKGCFFMKDEEEKNIYRVIVDFESELALGKDSLDQIFGTFQGQIQGNETSNGLTENAKNGQLNCRKDKRSDCFCGQIHRFRQCPYVNPTVRSTDWVPDPAVQARFDGFMHPAVKNVLNNAKKSIAATAKREYLEEPSHSQQRNDIVEFYTSNSESAFEYELRDSWIISITSAMHVCNDLTRFKRVDPVHNGKVLKFGSKSAPILAIGEVEIHPTADDDQQTKLTLRNVAFVPDLHTNIVSIQKAEQAGIYYNGRLSRLEYQDGHVLCHISSYYSQRVVEYNPPKVQNTKSAAVDHLTAATKEVSLA